MSSPKMNLSGFGKEILERLIAALDVDRPTAIKIALAKGLAIADGIPLTTTQPKTSVNNWTIPEGIIKDKDYLLFCHLIINEFKTVLTPNDINQYMLLFIESGLQEIKKELDELSSLEDYRIKILG